MIKGLMSLLNDQGLSLFFSVSFTQIQSAILLCRRFTLDVCFTRPCSPPLFQTSNLRRVPVRPLLRLGSIYCIIRNCEISHPLERSA